MQAQYSSPTSHEQSRKTSRIALLLILLLAVITLSSIAWMLLRGMPDDTQTDNRYALIADIYQDGELLQSINLNQVNTPYTFVVTGKNDCFNEIQVRPHSIGITTASCPDKLCVHQGFIDTSLLPITCLPNHLIIQIRREACVIPDALTY
ncbi:MAG: NusG domain II-containing protein [Lachnospiraceae bacterium]|nr:NusG domain II-containing protein [Lachnospiraceae bacterium]